MSRKRGNKSQTAGQKDKKINKKKADKKWWRAHGVVQQLLRCWMYHWHHTELRAEVQSERNLVRRTRVRVFVFRCACLCLSTAEWLSTATAVTDLSSTASLIYDTHEGMHTRLSQSCSNSKSRRRSSKAQHWSLYSLHSSTLFLKKKKLY